MPAQQRRWRDDEPSPTGARQESAAGAEKQAVNRGDRRPPRCPTEDRELVPRHDDFEFLELVRPNAQNHEIEKPAKQPVAPRHEHEASSIAGRWPNSTRQPTLMIFAGPPAWPDPSLCTLHAAGSSRRAETASRRASAMENPRRP